MHYAVHFEHHRPALVWKDSRRLIIGTIHCLDLRGSTPTQSRCITSSNSSMNGHRMAPLCTCGLFSTRDDISPWNGYISSSLVVRFLDLTVLKRIKYLIHICIGYLHFCRTVKSEKRTTNDENVKYMAYLHEQEP